MHAHDRVEKNKRACIELVRKKPYPLAFDQTSWLNGAHDVSPTFFFFLFFFCSSIILLIHFLYCLSACLLTEHLGSLLSGPGSSAYVPATHPSHPCHWCLFPFLFLLSYFFSLSLSLFVSLNLRMGLKIKGLFSPLSHLFFYSLSFPTLQSQPSITTLTHTTPTTTSLTHQYTSQPTWISLPKLTPRSLGPTLLNIWTRQSIRPAMPVKATDASPTPTFVEPPLASRLTLDRSTFTDSPTIHPKTTTPSAHLRSRTAIKETSAITSPSTPAPL